VPALSLTRDPVLTRLERGRDDATLFQAVQGDVLHPLPRTPLDGRPATPVEGILWMLVVTHLEGGRDEAAERGVSESLGWRPCGRG
jgi:hypothetical protein